MYAVGGSASPTIYSEGNRFLAPDDSNKKEVNLPNKPLNKSEIHIIILRQT